MGSGCLIQLKNRNIEKNRHRGVTKKSSEVKKGGVTILKNTAEKGGGGPFGKRRGKAREKGGD